MLGLPLSQSQLSVPGIRVFIDPLKWIIGRRIHMMTGRAVHPEQGGRKAVQWV